jgi:hypothetical protein
MKRISTVKVAFEDGTRAEAVVTTSGRQLTREEAQTQHDRVVDRIAESLRDLSYTSTAPWRRVRITGGQPT